jgi:hypothetical protein
VQESPGRHPFERAWSLVRRRSGERRHGLPKSRAALGGLSELMQVE